MNQLWAPSSMGSSIYGTPSRPRTWGACGGRGPESPQRPAALRGPAGGGPGGSGGTWLGGGSIFGGFHRHGMSWDVMGVPQLAGWSWLIYVDLWRSPMKKPTKIWMIYRGSPSLGSLHVDPYCLRYNHSYDLIVMVMWLIDYPIRTKQDCWTL